MTAESRDEALQYVRETVNIFRDTDSHYLPEAETTLENPRDSV
jgi:hypothetical protein